MQPRPLRDRAVGILVTALLLFAWSGASAWGRSRVPSLPFVQNIDPTGKGWVFYASAAAGDVHVTRDGEILYRLKGGRVVRERFLGPWSAGVGGKEEGKSRVNWYLGSESALWKEDVGTWRSVALGSYPGPVQVDLVARSGTVEKVFTVRPGGDVSVIRVLLSGAGDATVDEAGNLAVANSGGKTLFTRPLAYQVREGRRERVEVSYRLEGSAYGFRTGPYDPDLPLVIDPLLASSYAGGSSDETAYDVAVSGGGILIAGSVDSPDFPGLDGGVNRLGDAFVLRLDPDLTTVQAVSYFGGSMSDGVRSLAVVGDVIYAGGYNGSPDFPTTPGAAWSGTSLSGSFVLRLHARTLRLQAATSFPANLYAVASAPRGGGVFVAGVGNDVRLPVPAGNGGAFQMTVAGGADAFVARLSEDLTTLEASTFLGGEGLDIIYRLAVDGGGEVVAAGVTNSAAFPVPESAFDSAYTLDQGTAHPWLDGFVARLDRDLTRLAGSTYLGGSFNDSIAALAMDGASVLVGGNTASADFPCGVTFGPADGNDAFLVRLSPDLGEMQACALIGGGRTGKDSSEGITDIAVSGAGDIYVTGRSNGRDFPTTRGAFLEHPDGSYFGAFIAAFSRDLSRVKASTLVHGANEYLKALALGDGGDVIVVGDTTGPGYPVTPGALQAAHRSGDDLVVSRFSPDLTGPHIDVTPPAVAFGHLPAGMKDIKAITVHNTGGAVLTLRHLSFSPHSSQAFTLENPCGVIPPFDSCTVKIGFAPREAGRQSGSLEILSDDPHRPTVSVTLSGTAIALPVIEARPSLLSFGEVVPGRSSGAGRVTVTNAGTSDLIVTGIDLLGRDRGDFILVSEDCTRIRVPPEGVCRLNLLFVPSAEGVRQAQLEVHSNDPMVPVYPVGLAGTGSRAPHPDQPAGPSPVAPPPQEGNGKDGRGPGVAGWIALVILVLRILGGFPVSARGWLRWMGKR